MTMSPQEIQAKQFHVRFRGFDVEEVDGFLEQIAEHYLMLIEEKKSLASVVDSLTAELNSLKNEENSFKNAIISAQRVADEMMQRSQDQANSLLAKAQDEVSELKDAAHKEISALEYRVDELRGVQTRLRDDLRQVIGTYLEQIEQTFGTLNTDNLVESITTETTGLEDVEIVERPDDEVEASVDAEAGIAGLGELYEKIDLGSDGDSLLEKESPGEDLSAINLSEAGSAIPDLDDEVMFTLDDPLDKVEFDINLSEDDKR